MKFFTAFSQKWCGTNVISAKKINDLVSNEL